jgi:CysZ protein
MIPLFIKAFWRTIAQFFTKPVLKIFLKSLLTAIVLLLFSWIFLHYTIKTIIYITTTTPWLIHLTFLGDIGTLLILYISMPGIVVAVSSLFLEDIVLLIENKYYPDFKPTRPKFRDEIWLAIKFFFIMLGANLLALPFYFIPGVQFLVFLLVNSYLISKEYFDLIAIRHIAKKDFKSFYKKHVLEIFIGGAILCAPLAIPGLNLLLPIIATLFMAHILYPLMVKEKRAS